MKIKKSKEKVSINLNKIRQLKTVHSKIIEKIQTTKNENDLSLLMSIHRSLLKKQKEITDENGALLVYLMKNG